MVGGAITSPHPFTSNADPFGSQRWLSSHSPSRRPAHCVLRHRRPLPRTVPSAPCSTALPSRHSRTLPTSAPLTSHHKQGGNRCLVALDDKGYRVFNDEVQGYGAPLVWHCRDHIYCEGERVDQRLLERVQQLSVDNGGQRSIVPQICPPGGGLPTLTPHATRSTRARA